MTLSIIPTRGSGTYHAEHNPTDDGTGTHYLAFYDVAPGVRVQVEFVAPGPGDERLFTAARDAAKSTALTVTQHLPAAEPRCPRCGGLNGSHGLVHTRHGNGGGGNKPCPNTPPA